MSNKFAIIFSLIISIFIQGCSIGRNQSDCDANGCNYRKAGVCLDSYEVMKNLESIEERSYKNIRCRDR